MTPWRKLAIVAGGGALPVAIADHLEAAGASYYVARIQGMADPALERHPGGVFGLGEIGGRLKALKAAGCDAITFVGVVRRPEFSSLKLDARGAMLMPKVLAAAPRGDDALMRVLLDEHEREGLRIVGAEEAMSLLLIGEGPLGAHAPDARAMEDIAKGREVAGFLGQWDVGQAAVVCDGLVLALEAQEGTDLMLARVADLPPEVRGSEASRRGVLVKRPKPIQDRRVDLPTIGISTMEGAARAGLAGIAVEAGGAIVMQRAALSAAADRLGMFVYGFAR